MDLLKRFFPKVEIPKFEPIKYFTPVHMKIDIDSQGKLLYDDKILAITRCYKNLWVEEFNKRKELEHIIRKIVNNKKNKIEDKDLIELIHQIHISK